MNETLEQLAAIPPGTDLFAALGLPRRLNIDVAAMEATFYSLSRRFHPDRFATASPRARIVSLENSALVNKAYRTLRDPWERAQYLVELQTGGKADAGAQPPVDLFEDILDLQELLHGLRRASAAGEPAEMQKAQVARAAAPFREASARIEERRQELFDRWDGAWESGDEAAQRDVLARLKELLGERRYLARVLSDIDAALKD